VIWTDFLQFVVLIGGLLLMIWTLLSAFQWDVAGVWARAGEMTAAKTQTPHTTLVSWKLDLVTEAAIWGLFLHLLFYQMGTYGADQVIAQRYFTVDSFRKVAQSVVGSGFLVAGTVYALAMFGILLVVYYQDRPELSASLTRPDQILPHFVVHVLPAGVRGLIIAAILAATMSSVSGGLNSFATVGVVDLYKRLFRRAQEGSERGRLLLARVTTAVSGILATLAAVWISTRKTDIVETSATLASYFIGPITGIFLLGALTRRAHVGGVVVGAVAGLAVSGLHYGWDRIQDHVNWMWVAPLTCLATFLVGYLTSVVTPGLGRTGPPPVKPAPPGNPG
jgi:Na+/proline symporter